jgi:UDP-N-acetylglucosamine 2-epimerase (non-hydrolysing)
MKKKKLKVSFILGTRPEVIKLAPVILEGKRRGHKIKVVFTGQHKHLALPLLRFFGIREDINLHCMKKNQLLTGLSFLLLKKMNEKHSEIQGDLLVVQGDTTSAFIAGYWGFCEKIPVAHVEAGLRTYNLNSPFPEEGNRQLLGRITDLHLAPTRDAQDSLLQEGIAKKKISVTGNTAIDALHFTLKAIENFQKVPRELKPSITVENFAKSAFMLITAHRRESFGKPLKDICAGILGILERNPDLRAIFPVHPNPNVRGPVEKLLGKHPRILLTNPLPYVAFVDLMKRAEIILTDSGGVQEEAPTLKKPILVLRINTERPEGVKSGFSKLVGTNSKKIIQEAQRALKKGCEGKGKNPYGDGKASIRIWDQIEKRY